MVEFLSNEVTSNDIITGPHLIDIISSGMYNNPLMVIREYLQNAADSLDQSISEGVLTADKAEIKITVDGKNRRITIDDNGVGIPSYDIKRTLCSIAASKKQQALNRGFRGIGRLGGLGYCDVLRFTTKSKDEEIITEVAWDAEKLRNTIIGYSGIQDLSEMLSKCITIKQETSQEKHDSFFVVTMVGVKKFHNDELMHVPSLKTYLSTHAPVPFKDRFTFKNIIEDHVSHVDSYKAYNIFINNKKIYKPHKKIFRVSEKHYDEIANIKEFKIFNHERDIELARGWYAVTQFRSSIPKAILMRGITVRQGNILIGDSSYLAKFFSEKRFSTWCIGEIHVSKQVKLNARRDDFEHTQEYEALVEQFGLLGVHLSKICRESSIARSKEQHLNQVQNQVELFKQFSVAVNNEHKKELEKIIQRSGREDAAEIIKNIVLFDDLVKTKRIVKNDAREILYKLTKILHDKQNNPMYTSAIINKLIEEVFY